MVAPVLWTTPMKHAAKLRKQKHCIDTIAAETPSSNAEVNNATRCATSNHCLRRARDAHAAMQPKVNKKSEAITGIRVRNSDCRRIQDRVHWTVQVPHVLLFDSIQYDSNWFHWFDLLTEWMNEWLTQSLTAWLTKLVLLLTYLLDCSHCTPAASTVSFLSCAFPLPRLSSPSTRSLLYKKNFFFFVFVYGIELTLKAKEMVLDIYRYCRQVWR